MHTLAASFSSVIFSRLFLQTTNGPVAALTPMSLARAFEFRTTHPPPLG